jgi:intracellular sulfur oxidation DsrE/DsrF family protein
MSRPQRLSSLAAALLLAVLAPAAHAEKVGAGGTVAGKTAATQNRIVIQINEDDSKKWHAVLGNIRNIQAELGKDQVKIAVVVIGYGLGMLTIESLSATDVQDAIATGVEFLACGNSMKAQQIALDDMVDGVKVAKAGYVELMRRQQQGWAYLRP